MSMQHPSSSNAVNRRRRHHQHHLHHHYRLQGLALLAHSDSEVSRTRPSIPSMIALCLFFVLLGGNQTPSEEFGQLSSLRCVHNSCVDIYFLV
jgi:hypothetical protein